jgi:hypothetical protein
MAVMTKRKRMGSALVQPMTIPLLRRCARPADEPLPLDIQLSTACTVALYAEHRAQHLGLPVASGVYRP